MTTSNQNDLSINSDSSITKPAMEPWKIKTLTLGGVLGATVGLLSAFLLIKNSEQRGIQPTLGAREGFQIAILGFGLIRSIANLWED